MSAQQMEDPEILSTEEISGSEAEEEQEDLESPPEPMQEQEQLQNIRGRSTLSRRKRGAGKTASAGAEDNHQTRQLRNRIFPTLYAIFQQSRGSPTAFKIKNRSLRSLLKSCLYHRSEDQLLRTQEDAEALLNKYCQGLEPEAK
ncbi:33K [Bat adenovirus 2]|uniref:33K n=1 Tax=Bat adenovirus 2 TaxID=696069 RepID=G1FQN2_9ADEN|nr:33K [Bat adenovirus 2]AEM06279.1 33K [Bat adenovirus 2]QDA77090.1 33K [Bat mastadenovirus B]